MQISIATRILVGDFLNLIRMKIDTAISNIAVASEIDGVKHMFHSMKRTLNNSWFFKVLIRPPRRGRSKEKVLKVN